jgi:hypothetical protein
MSHFRAGDRHPRRPPIPKPNGGSDAATVTLAGVHPGNPATHSSGVAGLDVLEDRSVRVSGDEPGAVRRGSRPLHDLAARRLKGSEPSVMIPPLPPVPSAP